MLLPCTLRPRRGRHAAAVVQKTIKKLIPRRAGLLLLFLWIRKERERNISSLDFELVAILPRTRRQSDLFFTTTSSVGSYKGVREDHLPKEDLRNLPRPLDSAYARRPVALARKRLKLHSEEPDLRRVRSSSSNQVIATVVNGCVKRHKRYVPLHISCPCLC